MSNPSDRTVCNILEGNVVDGSDHPVIPPVCKNKIPVRHDIRSGKPRMIDNQVRQDGVFKLLAGGSFA